MGKQIEKENYNIMYARTLYIIQDIKIRKMNQDNIHLRALEMEDLDLLYEVENDMSLWGVGNTNVPYSRQNLIDYIASATADIYADKQVRLMVENDSHETVGIVDLINFDPRHLRAELGIMIKREWQGRGLGKKVVSLIQDYARNVLHLHQVYAIVAESNEKAAKMLSSAGFIGDKMLKDWLCKGQGYEDAYLFQCFL